MRAFAAASMHWASDSSRAREESKMTYRLPLFLGGAGGEAIPRSLVTKASLTNR